MANTTLTAKNVFSEGLVMDFSPDNTSASTLTSALNATLLTSNGNEMALLNDFGNGRVETAYLPEGYVPVGTCEFGDIIYIVSYNPLTNKSLIGCFPSPERNIESDEVSDLQLSISNSDFIEGDKVKKVTVKKILFDKSINPGDRFIIYSDSLDSNKDKLSDYGNTDNVHGYWPKLTKVHVVAIEDSGKMIYLDSSLKWYKNDYYINKMSDTDKDLDEYREVVSSAYSVFQSKVSGKLALLVELERINSFSNTYSVYTDKNGEDTTYNIFFNVSWTSNHNDINPSAIKITKSEWANKEVYITSWAKEEGEYHLNSKEEAKLPVEKDTTCKIHRTYKLEEPSTDYSTYLKESYNYKINEAIKLSETDEKISSILIKTEDKKTYPITNNDNPREYWANVSKAVKDDKGALVYRTIDKDGKELDALFKALNDDVVNNYFHKAVTKFIGNPTYQSTTIIDSEEKDNDLSQLVWNYTVAPVMPYGVLDYLGINGTIDFSKINTGACNLTGWRYYNSGITSTLTLDIENYPKEDLGIAEVVLEFYDNQGKAAAYHITNKESFSGTFTEYIVLNSKGSNYKLNNIGADGKSFTHKGLEDPEGTIEEGEKHYLDDAGTIYANALYKVLITIKYCNKDALGNYDLANTSMFKYYARWYYTISMFNENYFDTKDFDILIPTLTFDCVAEFSNNGLQPKVVAYNAENTLLEKDAKPFNTIGANIYHINQDGAADTTGNIKMKVISGLELDYNVFALDETRVAEINIDIALGDSSIMAPLPRLLSESLSVNLPYILPVIAEKLNELNGINNESGYVSKKYGTNNYQLSKTVTELLKITELNGEEIYANAESYKSYADSFCINFVTGSNLSNKELEYLTVGGDTTKLDKYVYTTSNALDLYKSGITLTLTGIFFNKFMFSDINEKNIKKINNILNSNSLDKIGMGISGNHLYFKEVLTLGLGESRGAKGNWTGTYFKSNDVSNHGWLGKSLINYEGLRKESWEPEVNDEEFLNLFKGVLNYLVPLIYGKSNNSLEFILVSKDCLKTIRNYIPLIGEDNREQLYTGKRNIPHSDLTHNGNASHLISTLCFRDQDGLVKILDDYFVSTLTNLGFKNNRAENDYGIKLGLTLADLIGGLYSLLYFTIGNKKANLRNNFTYLDLFKEIWNKDFVIQYKFNDTDKSKPKGLNYLLFHGSKFTDYCKAIEIPTDGKEVKGTDTNIKFLIRDINKTVQFQYEVMYDITDIKILFNLISDKVLFMTAYDNNGKDISRLVEGDAQENTLYTITENKLLKFSNSSILYNIESWEGTDTKLVPKYLDTLLETNNAALSKFFSIEGGTLKLAGIENLPRYSNTYELWWWSEGDDSKLKEIPGASIFNKLSI